MEAVKWTPRENTPSAYWATGYQREFTFKISSEINTDSLQGIDFKKIESMVL